MRRGLDLPERVAALLFVFVIIACALWWSITPKGPEEMTIKFPPNFGRTAPAQTTNGPGAQLARVEQPATGDFTVYLYGWNTPSDTNNVIGVYNVSHGSGGVSTLEQIRARARGTVLHYTASLVQVDSAANQSAPLTSLAKARIGFGRPSPFSLPLLLQAAAGADGAVVRIPDWTTSIRVLGCFDGAVAPATDARIMIGNANDPTVASAGIGFKIADLFDFRLPLQDSAGFLKLHGGAQSATLYLEATGVR